MFHIKDDPRSRKTAAAFGDAMLRCLRDKPISEVTVSDLHRETGMARSTFYRLFDTPEDVLHYLCSQYVEETAACFEDRDFADVRELSIASIRISLQNHRLLDVLARNHRLELLNALYLANFRHMRCRIPVARGLDEVSDPYIQALLSMTMSTLQSTWVQQGGAETPEQLFDHLQAYGQLLVRIFDSDIRQ